MKQESLYNRENILKCILNEIGFQSDNNEYSYFRDIIICYLEKQELCPGEKIEFKEIANKIIKKNNLDISSIQLERIIRKSINKIISNAYLDIKKCIFKLDNINSILYVIASIANYTKYVECILQNNYELSIKEAIYHENSCDDIKYGREYFVDRMMFEMGLNPSFVGYFYFKKSVLYYLEELDIVVIRKVLFKDIYYELSNYEHEFCDVNHLQKMIEMLIKNALKDGKLENYKLNSNKKITAYELVSQIALSIKTIELGGEDKLLECINKELCFFCNYCNSVSWERINLFDTLMKKLNISPILIDTVYFKTVFFLFLNHFEMEDSPVALNNILRESADVFELSDVKIRNSIVNVSSLIPIDDLLKTENINMDINSKNSLQIFFYKFSMYFKLLERKFSFIVGNKLDDTYCYDDKKKLIDIILVELGIQPTYVGYYYVRYIIFRLLEYKVLQKNIKLDKYFFEEMADVFRSDVNYIKWGIDKVYYASIKLDNSNSLKDYVFGERFENKLDSWLNNIVRLVNSNGYEDDCLKLVKKRTPNVDD